MFNNEIKRLKFEDVIWIIFIGLCLLNIYADHDEINYLNTHDRKYKKEGISIGKITLAISILIYLYFMLRNYDAYNKCSINEKRLYTTKVFGSILILVGTLCLFYFQMNQNDFLESPEI